MPTRVTPPAARTLAALACTLIASPAGRTQAAPTRTPTAPVVELSPFEVRSGDDVGYQAVNTTNGSRLNTRLKDTPASLSPFTPEFLSDIAATSNSDMLDYTTNIEVDTEDATNGFNHPEGELAISSDYQFRMRGMAAGSSRDFVDSSIPVQDRLAVGEAADPEGARNAGFRLDHIEFRNGNEAASAIPPIRAYPPSDSCLTNGISKAHTASILTSPHLHRPCRSSMQRVTPLLRSLVAI